MFLANIAKRTISGLLPKLTTAYRMLRDALDRREPLKATPWGFVLAGNRSMALGEFEPLETETLRRIMPEVDILVNVGANIGYYCCHALSLGKQVVAVEPIERNIAYLLRNIKENGWSSKVEIFPVALGEKSDILPIWGGRTGASLVRGWAGNPDTYVTYVPILTLDRVLGTVLQGTRALIVIDVEGVEYEVLKGALSTLENVPRPIWIVEIGVTIHQPKERKVNPYLADTFKLFYEFGYSAYAIDSDLTPITMESVIRAAKLKSGLPAHNFLFKSTGT